jgi:hypothetical protein
MQIEQNHSTILSHLSPRTELQLAGSCLSIFKMLEPEEDSNKNFSSVQTAKSLIQEQVDKLVVAGFLLNGQRLPTISEKRGFKYKLQIPNESLRL